MDGTRKDSQNLNMDQDSLIDEELNRKLTDEIDARAKGEKVEEAHRHHHHHHHHSNHRRTDSSEASSGRSRKKRRKRREPLTAGKVVLIVLSVIILFLLVLIGLFFYLRSKGEKSLNETVVLTPIVEETAEMESETETETGPWIINKDGTVSYKGETYRYNDNLINVLVMGIDHELTDISSTESGLADTDILVTMDKTTGFTRMLNISRDTITSVKVYGADGRYAGIEDTQLCIAYSFGDGKHSSCLNTVDSVSHLLYDLPINGYAALDYSQIAVLNDAVGGVEVTILDDVFDFGKKGETVRLKGQEAQTYVRSRDTELLDSNNNRMARQKQWLLSFLGAAREKIKSDVTFPITLYRLLSSNMVTSIDISEVTYLGTLFARHGFSEGDFCSVAGEVVEGNDGYAEFHADEDALMDLVIEMFYSKV